MGRDWLGRKRRSPQYLSIRISRVSCWAVKIDKGKLFSHGVSDVSSQKLPGHIFDKLVSLGAHLVGPPAIRALRARGEKLFVKRSPVFCLQVSLSFNFCPKWFQMKISLNLFYLLAARLQYCPFWLPQKVRCEKHARKGGFIDFPQVWVISDPYLGKNPGSVVWGESDQGDWN